MGTIVIVAWAALSTATVGFMYCCSKVSGTGSDDRS